MKKQLCILSVLIIGFSLLISCSKSNSSKGTPAPEYLATQGKVTGTGSVTFSTTGVATTFKKTADTVILLTNIDPAVNITKKFTMGIVAKAPGTYNFINASANTSGNFTGAVAFYRYGTVNAAGRWQPINGSQVQARLPLPASRRVASAARTLLTLLTLTIMAMRPLPSAAVSAEVFSYLELPNNPN